MALPQALMKNMQAIKGIDVHSGGCAVHQREVQTPGEKHLASHILAEASPLAHSPKLVASTGWEESHMTHVLYVAAMQVRELALHFLTLHHNFKT